MPQTPIHPLMTVVLKTNLMGFNQSAPNLFDLSTKVSVSQKIGPGRAQAPRTPVQPRRKPT